MLTHEDKLYQGAFVASLTIPWGGARNDENGKGGYHLVWTRDMVESAMGLLAAGNTAAPLRALIYLAARQEEDGEFPQNFWVNGEAFRNGMQLDEIAFPVLLAWRLHQLQLLGEFNPLVMVKRAAAFLLHQRTGHGRRTLGRSKRLFAFHAGRRDLGFYLRGGFRARAKRTTKTRRPSLKAMPTFFALIWRSGR